MKYSVVVKLKDGKSKKDQYSSSKDTANISHIMRILNKHPEAKEIIINGVTVWKR